MEAGSNQIEQRNKILRNGGLGVQIRKGKEQAYIDALRERGVTGESLQRGFEALIEYVGKLDATYKAKMLKVNKLSS